MGTLRPGTKLKVQVRPLSLLRSQLPQRGSLYTMYRHRAGQGSGDDYRTVHVLAARLAGRAAKGSDDD